MKMKKNNFLRIPVILILLIPFYIAIYHFSLISSDKLTVDNVTKIIVTGANNTEYEYSARDDIKLYIQIIENTKTVDEPLRNLDTEESFTVSFFKGQNQIKYQLYLSQNLEDCLMRDSEDTLYLLRKTDAEKLLATPIADSLYRYNNVPTVQVVYDDGVEITEAYPSYGEWYLKKPDNKYVESNVQNIFKTTNNIRAARGKFLEFKFDAEPDLLNIVIYNENEVVFNGSYENFHEFIFDSNTNLRYVMTAEWNQNEYTDYSGIADYTFNVEYSVPPTFDISKSESDSVLPGEIVIVTALNMRDTDSPMVTTDIGYTANFIKVNDKHIALLPVGTESMGKNFDIALSGSSVAEDKNFKLYVSEQTYNSINLGAQTEMYTNHKSAAAIETKQKAYDTILATGKAQKIYWANDPQFIMPHQGNILINFGWSTTVNMGGHSQNKGINIEAKERYPVAAANSGIVVFAGTVPDDGNLVVIDHGGDVRSWYGHLDTVNVSVGDEVSKGQEIAVSGTSGLYTNYGANLYFAISVHSVFVNPTLVIENGILPN